MSVRLDGQWLLPETSPHANRLLPVGYGVLKREASIVPVLSGLLVAERAATFLKEARQENGRRNSVTVGRPARLLPPRAGSLPGRPARAGRLRAPPRCLGLSAACGKSDASSRASPWAGRSRRAQGRAVRAEFPCAPLPRAGGGPPPGQSGILASPHRCRRGRVLRRGRAARPPRPAAVNGRRARGGAGPAFACGQRSAGRRAAGLEPPRGPPGGRLCVLPQRPPPPPLSGRLHRSAVACGSRAVWAMWSSVFGRVAELLFGFRMRGDGKPANYLDFNSVYPSKW